MNMVRVIRNACDRKAVPQQRLRNLSLIPDGHGIPDLPSEAIHQPLLHRAFLRKLREAAFQQDGEIDLFCQGQHKHLFAHPAGVDFPAGLPYGFRIGHPVQIPDRFQIPGGQQGCGDDFKIPEPQAAVAFRGILLNRQVGEMNPQIRGGSHHRNHDDG